MTFEEIQQAIQQMFAVQRELQESQLRLAEQMAEQQVEHDRRMADHEQWINNFRQLLQDFGERQIRAEAEQDRQERILNQLIGYSLTNETEHLNLEERMMRLEQRIEQVRGSR